MFVLKLNRLDRIISDFLTAVRPFKPNYQPYSAEKILEDSVKILKPEIESKGIFVEQNYDSSIGPIMADEFQLRQAVLNLLKNSLEATPRGGKILLTTEKEGEFVQINIKDSGKGYPQKLY